METSPGVVKTIRVQRSSSKLHSFIGLLLAAFAASAAAVPGDVDIDFNPNPNGLIFLSAVRPDGRILIGGEFTTLHGIARNYLGNLNSDGTLDAGFYPNVIGDFVQGYRVGIYTTLEQMDGKIVI